MNCHCDFEQPSCYLKKTVEANKKHRCDECYRAINKGDQYEVVSGKWEGILSRFKTCKKCVGLREYTEANIKCVCWSHGSMIEDCIEALKEYRYELPGLLFGGYRFIANRNK